MVRFGSVWQKLLFSPVRFVSAPLKLVPFRFGSRFAVRFLGLTVSFEWCNFPCFQSRILYETHRHVGHLWSFTDTWCPLFNVLKRTTSRVVYFTTNVSTRAVLRHNSSFESFQLFCAYRGINSWCKSSSGHSSPGPPYRTTQHITIEWLQDIRKRGWWYQGKVWSLIPFAKNLPLV